MTTTQSLLDVLPRVARFFDIRLAKVSSIDSMGTMARAYGAQRIIKSESLTTDSVVFLARFDVYQLDKTPERWRTSSAIKYSLCTLSNTLEEIPELILTFLDANPQFFRTFTDEWGRVYGEKE